MGGLLGVLLSVCADAAPFDYALKPIRISDGVHVFEGKRENFSRNNGGNIVNTGTIDTAAGAVVIDTGPSRRYGEQLRSAIVKLTGKGIAQVYITHAHPDHFLGNQAFAEAGIAALPATMRAIQTIGEALSANLYRMVGGWMEGTVAVTPKLEAQPGEVEIGGRKLRLIALSGHTESDLVIYDDMTATLFTGDLAFFERASTTPNADIDDWLRALETLEKIPFKQLVPGHGPVVQGVAAITQTRAYLSWLRASLEDAAIQGLDMNEVMQIAVPPEFSRLAVFREEFERSVVHLYPGIEIQTLKKAQP